MAARTMNVHVRQEHIDLAQHGTADRCPLALALLEKERTEWCVGSDYCNPVLKPGERWDHSDESRLIMDIWDNFGNGIGLELRPQTVTLRKQPPPNLKKVKSDLVSKSHGSASDRGALAALLA